ncbi:MAG: protein kinase [Myxococcales bacterium]|nr:protein kinase [Myxococcales bacterium]MCB9714283.1 protein kinase [Myxococcales bacterium]
MAEVWLASTTGPTGVHKLLVIKRLKRGHEDEPELVTMFLDEARIAVRLAHPNVVQTYEVDTDDGLPFIAMEYLDGQPLHRVLRRFARRGGLSRDLRLWMLAELLQGLHHAHELRDYDGTPLRVVHRDVNPQNVLVTFHGEIKLMDFGIAKAMDSVAHTDVGMFKGKLAYMAPEQARGGTELDRRVDLFAVGVMMWEALTEERMWGGRTDIEIATALCEGWVPPLPESASIPDPLREICTKAIAVDPDARWPDAASMHEALRDWLDEHGGAPSPAALGRSMAECFTDERARREVLIQRHARDPTGAAPDRGWDPPVSSPEDETRRITPPLPTTRPVPMVSEPPPSSTRPRRWWAAAALVGAASLAAVATALVHDSPDDAEPTVASDPREDPEASTRASPTAEPSSTGTRCTTEGPPVELTGELEADATLGCDRRYLLRYTVRVPRGVTLTIEPGTTILGDPVTKGTLVVQPGGRLVAEGRADAPIVLTSALPEGRRAPGDWGGVLVLGHAPINLRDHAGQPILGRVEGLTEGGTFGGDDPDDDSGVLRYLRIEYSGVELAPNNEVNGLTLAGVGRGTRLDHVQVRHTADDCFEFFGGTVSGSHLLCDDPGDDGFDWDLGYQGELRFLVVRALDPGRGQHGIEGDGDPRGERAEPRSRPHVSNATVCGTTSRGAPRFGMLLRRGTDARVERSVVLGFDATIELRDRFTTLTLEDSVLGLPLVDPAGAAERPFDLEAMLRAPERLHAIGAPADLDCASPSIDALRPERPLRAEDPDGQTSYRGAFRDRDDRWDEGWAVWSDD